MNYSDIISEYRMLYDHHTHTTYSHGTGSIEDNVKVAYEKGIRSIAITDHGPGNFSYGIKMERLPEMHADVDALRKKYPDMEILLGVEANTLRVDPFMDISREEAAGFDLIIVGYHFAVWKAGMVENWMYKHLGKGRGNEDGSRMEGTRLMVKNTEMITNCLLANEEAGIHIDVLTHPGDKGPFDIAEIARVCENTGTLLEINDKHKHMTVEEIRIAQKFDVSFVIGSDAHCPEKVGSFEGPLARALEAGLDPARIVNIAKY